MSWLDSLRPRATAVAAALGALAMGSIGTFYDKQLGEYPKLQVYAVTQDSSLTDGQWQYACAVSNESFVEAFPAFDVVLSYQGTAGDTLAPIDATLRAPQGMNVNAVSDQEHALVVHVPPGLNPGERVGATTIIPKPPAYRFHCDVHGAPSMRNKTGVKAPLGFDLMGRFTRWIPDALWTAAFLLVVVCAAAVWWQAHGPENGGKKDEPSSTDSPSPDQ